MSVTEAQAAAAIVVLERMIDAARNGNQAGENAVVAAAAGLDTVAALSALIGAFDGLIGDSEGVYGLHPNGDPAPWSELTAGGRFEEWTAELETARDAIAKATGK